MLHGANVLELSELTTDWQMYSIGVSFQITGCLISVRVLMCIFFLKQRSPIYRFKRTKGLLHILGPEALATGCSLLGSREESRGESRGDSLREPVGRSLQGLWPYILRVRSTCR
jgi:hypothetical protein